MQVTMSNRIELTFKLTGASVAKEGLRTFLPQTGGEVFTA